MDEVTRERIEAATVRLPDKGGQGVLIPGNLILTAAHCIEWDGAPTPAHRDEARRDVPSRPCRRRAAR